MKQPPFNLTVVMIGTYFSMMILGGILAVILSAIGFSGFWGIFLSAFLTVPFGGTIRFAIASMLAEQAGAAGKPPMAFSLPVRLLIGAVVAAVIAYVFSFSTFYSFGFLMGAVAALLTAVIISLVFFVKVSFAE